MVLAKLSAKKYSRAEMDPIVLVLTQHVVQCIEPIAIYLIGSCARDSFTEYSDIDFVVVVSSDEDVRTARNVIHLNRPHQTIPVDFILMDSVNFAAGSTVGGIAFEARTNGELLYTRGDCVS